MAALHTLGSLFSHLYLSHHWWSTFSWRTHPIEQECLQSPWKGLIVVRCFSPTYLGSYQQLSSYTRGKYAIPQGSWQKSMYSSLCVCYLNSPAALFGTTPKNLYLCADNTAECSVGPSKPDGMCAAFKTPVDSWLLYRQTVQSIEKQLEKNVPQILNRSHWSSCFFSNRWPFLPSVSLVL